MSVQQIRFRSNEEGLVILQVRIQTSPSYSFHEHSTWRDAKVEDLLEVANFCKTDTSLIYESLNNQISKLRDDIFNRLAPSRPMYQRPLTDEEQYQIDALNQHQERDL
jgi:hypothetical protein